MQLIVFILILTLLWLAYTNKLYYILDVIFTNPIEWSGGGSHSGGGSGGGSRKFN